MCLYVCMCICIYGNGRDRDGLLQEKLSDDICKPLMPEQFVAVCGQEVSVEVCALARIRLDYHIMHRIHA